MEQYLNLIWKNYTASLPQNSDENYLDEQDKDVFTDNDLHYKIPFWVGTIVIALFFVSAIIAIIRYCCTTLCSLNTETEKVTLMPPNSPHLSSSIVNTIQRSRHNPILNHSSDDNETVSTSPGQSRDYHSNRSIVPIIHHRREIQSDYSDNHYFSPTQITSSRTSVEYRKKLNDIYILPVSPTLSSSSSITNTDGFMKTGSNTMPNRSRRYISTNHGIQNNSFIDSPQSKDRTLPRTLKHFQPPSQPPPLPPTIAQIHINHHEKSSIINSDEITLRIDTTNENQIRKSSQPPPPIPCRSQKPSILPIGFEDCSERTWPNPPESMSTSICYDHLIPTVIMRHNSTTNFRHTEQCSILTESET